MKSKIEPNQIARTGRVQQWIDNPTNRLPVSCTIFNVQDSMEGTDGIEASWRFVSHALRYGAGVAVHLSELRPKGTTTNKGPDSLVASGPVSFGKIYSTLNEILGAEVRTVTVLLSSILILTTPIFLSSCKQKEPSSHGLKDVLTSPQDSGLIQKLQSRKQYLEALQEETFGSTK